MRPNLIKLFTEDDRAVAPIIGFILLFGILTIAFAGYQAERVPQQNAETEFQHYQDVQNDLIVVRNAISRAGQQDQSQFESVRLGTTYRERVIALNPPDPAGTLRTEGPYEITLANETVTRTVDTQFLEYQNGYNELNIEPIYYENSVLYLESEGGNRVFFEDQNLVRENGRTVVITALQREFSRSATGRVTLELYPTDAGKPLPTEEVDVTLPTRLPEPYWREQIEGTDPISKFGYNDRTDDVNQVKFTVNSEDLEFNTVGVGDEPDRTGAISDMNDGADDENGAEEGNLGDNVAFNDANGDGVYNPDEQAYSAEDIKNFNDPNADLVIANDSVERGARNITANSVKVNPGVTLGSDNNKLTINSATDIDIRNATVRSSNDNDIKASAGGSILVDGANIQDTEKDRGDFVPIDGELKANEEAVIFGTPDQGEVEKED